MLIEFEGEIIYWRGPSPFYFVPVPEAESANIRAVASLVTYGWGVIPVTARIGRTVWQTSLFPQKNRSDPSEGGRGYLVPIKDAIRKAEKLGLGDFVNLTLEISL